MKYITGACLGDASYSFFFFSKLSHKADWIFLLSTSMCTKCNPGVVGIKHELTYTSYSLNGYSEEEYELGWINPLRADSVPSAIVNSKVAWNKEKAWWLVAVSLCSKELQLMVLQTVPGGSVINHKKLEMTWITTEKKMEKQIATDLYNKILQSSKNEWTIATCNNLN